MGLRKTHYGSFGDWRGLISPSAFRMYIAENALISKENW